MFAAGSDLRYALHAGGRWDRCPANPGGSRSFFEMILCLTPNPAIDRTLLLPGLTAGNVHRAETVIVVAGGKGLNVARVIRTLGGEPLCMGFTGGHAGRLLADLAQNEGLNSCWTWTDSETRTCAIFISPD